MPYTSIIRLCLFSFAIYANVMYALFLLNPTHAGNILLYSLTILADSIAIFILGYTWISCLYFEIFKSRYHNEISYLQDKGKHLLSYPTAILIPVVNEPIGIIRKTLVGALSLEGNKKVYLLDDADREDLKILSLQLGITYLRRQDKRFNKAGNINNALQYITEPFVAVFDADFIPKAHFLKETLPLFIDKSIAIVQTPQVYYNKNSFFSRGFKNFQTLFYSYIMPAKSLQHSAFCVGTNVVYKTAALKYIGGIPNLIHSEDVHTSLKFYEYGLRTIYLNRELALGLSPDNVISFFNQQFRWAKGGLHMLFKKNTLLNNKLSLDQRLHFFFSNLYYLSGVAIFIYLITPLLAIIFNTSSINSDFFFQWVWVYSMFFAANFVLYAIFAKNNIFYAAVLGIFCYIPYTKAISAVIFNRNFTWKTTGAHSSDIVTRLIAPLLPYIVTSGSLFYMFLSQFLAFQTTFLLYAFWIGVNSIVVLYLIFQSYWSVLHKRKRANKKVAIQPETIPYMKLQTA